MVTHGHQPSAMALRAHAKVRAPFSKLRNRPFGQEAQRSITAEAAAAAVEGGGTTMDLLDRLTACGKDARMVAVCCASPVTARHLAAQFAEAKNIGRINMRDNYMVIDLVREKKTAAVTKQLLAMAGDDTSTLTLKGITRISFKALQGVPGMEWTTVYQRVEETTGDALLDALAEPGTMTTVVVLRVAGDAAAAAEAIFNSDTQNITRVTVRPGGYIGVELKKERKKRAIIRELITAAGGDTAHIIARATTWPSWRAQVAEAGEDAWTEVGARDISTLMPQETQEGSARSYHTGQGWKEHRVSRRMSRMMADIKVRDEKRGHEHNEVRVLTNLRDAVMELLQEDKRPRVRSEDGERTLFLCGCTPRCTRTLQLFGPNAISPDRVNNSIGYGEGEQTIRFITSACNTRIQDNSVKEERAHHEGWVSTQWRHMWLSETRRMAVLRKNRPTDPKVVEYDALVKSGKMTKEAYKELAERLFRSQEVCEGKDCDRTLSYGDDNGIIRYKDDASQASIDRGDNTDFYITKNADGISKVRLVCQACQKNSHHRSRCAEPAEAPSDDCVDLTPEKMEEMSAWMEARQEDVKRTHGIA